MKSIRNPSYLETLAHSPTDASDTCAEHRVVRHVDDVSLAPVSGGSRWGWGGGRVGRGGGRMGGGHWSCAQTWVTPGVTCACCPARLASHVSPARLAPPQGGVFLPRGTLQSRVGAYGEGVTPGGDPRFLSRRPVCFVSPRPCTRTPVPCPFPRGTGVLPCIVVCRSLHR